MYYSPESFTAGALRVIRRAELRAQRRASGQVDPTDLFAALAEETESRSAALTAEFGLIPQALLDALGIAEVEIEDAVIDRAIETIGDASAAIPHASESRDVLIEAVGQARSFDRGRLVGTEHMLSAILTVLPAIRASVESAGLRVVELLDRINEQTGGEIAPIPLAPDIPPLELTEPGQGDDLGRILDASANRAREGLRVVEDYVRFALNDSMLTRRLKDVRHRLGEAIRAIDPEILLASRDTPSDVGTHIMTVSEQTRENPRAVLFANFKRVEEALRTLEEYSKLIDVWASGKFEVLRYDVYTLEKLTITAMASRRVLGDAKLMVLVGGLPTLGDLTWVVGEALAGGADVIQLREKDLDDREWLSRAREVRILTARSKARFIVNDRPDLARLAGADGVHLGQDDLSVRDARRIVGPTAIVGVSTHDGSQLERAVLDAASYLGVGPMFASRTKEFDDFAGLAFARRASEQTTLPWFAIGGITAENLPELIEAGARRVAVSAAVVRAEFPRKAAAELRALLDEATD